VQGRESDKQVGVQRSTEAIVLVITYTISNGANYSKTPLRWGEASTGEKKHEGEGELKAN